MQTTGRTVPRSALALTAEGGQRGVGLCERRLEGLQLIPIPLGRNTRPAVDRLLGAMAILIEYPILAAALGAVLLGLGWRMHRRIAVCVGLVWLAYAVYEFGMQQRWLCSGECNIRVDLLVIYPVLLIGLGAAGVSLFRALPGARRSA